MRIHHALGPLLLLLSSTLALVSCAGPVSLGEDAGGVGGSASSGAGVGGGEATVLGDSNTPGYLVADEANIYWDEGGTILGMAKSGGAPWVVVKAAAPSPYTPSVFDLGVDSTGVYYTEHSDNLDKWLTAIQRAPLLGGAPSLVAHVRNFGCFTLAGPDLYYADASVAVNFGGAVYKLPTAGGPAVTVVFEPTNLNTEEAFEHATVAPMSVVVDGLNAYWVNLGLDNGASDSWGIASTALLGGPVVRIGDATPQQSARCKNLALDDSYVYWWRLLPTPGILRASKQGGPETLLTSDVAQQIAVDGSYIYYTTGTSVRRVAKTGGDPEILIDNQLSPFAIVVDATHVYWTNRGALFGAKSVGGGAVLRLVKP
jgi:hypothetical protein